MPGGGNVLTLKSLAGADERDRLGQMRAAQQVGHGQARKQVAGGPTPCEDDMLRLTEHFFVRQICLVPRGIQQQFKDDQQ